MTDCTFASERARPISRSFAIRYFLHPIWKNGNGSGAKNPESATRWAQYVQGMLMVQSLQCSREHLPPERLQELRTLSEALNMAGRGNTAAMCDILAQRFCAVEQRALGQHDLARGLEIVQKRRQGLTSLRVLDRAGKALASEQKVLAAHDRARNRTR